VIGGAGVYEEALTYADSIVLSVIERDYRGDTKFPRIDQSVFHIWGVESGANENFPYHMEFWSRIEKTESQPCQS
jgi:dihydrofolate reductase